MALFVGLLMYTRIRKIKRANGHIDEYVEILESYREDGKIHKKRIANLGNKSILKTQLQSLLKILDPSLLVNPIDSIQSKSSAPYGIIFLVHHYFSELRLWEALDSLSNSNGWADRVAVLVANRLSKPSSEHGLAGWLDTTYVIDRDGNRFLPEWKQHERVKVDLSWLQTFYRALDVLIENKETIEKELYLQLRDLFHLKVEMVFYDLTSTYFEGSGPAGIARYGHSRDKKKGNRQVLVGLVMANGFPIAHHTFAGNLRDHKTVETVIKDLEKRFEVGRIVFVGDRGMVTADVFSMVKDHQHGYLVGLQRRQRENIIRYIEQMEGPGELCSAGLTAKEKALETRVWEVPGDNAGERIFIVHSDERQAYEEAMREKSRGRVKEALEGLKERVATGRLKKKEEIGFAAGKILSQNHGHRYYDWKLTEEGQFEYFDHPVNFEREKKIEGKYVIQTEEKDLAPVEAVTRYKELSDVERGFRSLKDVIDMRPIYHQTESRTRAHIFVATLAFLIERMMEKRLKEANSILSVKDAIQALHSIQVVEYEVGDQKKKGVTAGSDRARQALKALKLNRVELPKTLPPRKLVPVGSQGKFPF